MDSVDIQGDPICEKAIRELCKDAEELVAEVTLGDSDRACVNDVAPWPSPAVCAVLKPGAPLKPVLCTFAVCQLESAPSNGLLHAKHRLKIAW